MESGEQGPAAFDAPEFGDACRVCGFDVGGGWEAGGPLYIICACCGAESGVEDSPTGTALAYLLDWVAAGTPWFNPADEPQQWDLRQQLHRAGLRRPLQRFDSYTDGSEPHRVGAVRFAVKPWWLRRSSDA